MVLRVKRLTLRVTRLTLRVKQAFMTPMAYHNRQCEFIGCDDMRYDLSCTISILSRGIYYYYYTISGRRNIRTSQKAAEMDDIRNMNIPKHVHVWPLYRYAYFYIIALDPLQFFLTFM